MPTDTGPTEAAPGARSPAGRRRGAAIDDRTSPDPRRDPHRGPRAGGRGADAVGDARLEAAGSSRPGRRPLLGGLARSLPYVVGGLVLVFYFVWLMTQMSTFAHGGLTVPEATFGAIFLGILSGAAALLGSRGHRS